MGVKMSAARRALGCVVGAAIAGGCMGEITEQGASGGATPPGPGTKAAGLCADRPFVRRLTVEEYVATVRVTLGVDIATAATAVLPKDLRADGFSNTATALIITDAHVEGYESLAQVALDAADWDALVAKHAPCTNATEACRSGFVEGLGQALLRAPIQEAERASLLPLFDVAEQEGDGFAVGARLVALALLQSPRFLYRVEHEVGSGKARKLDSWEMASRLSFLLWGEPPDEALVEAATKGALSTDAQLEATVDRLLLDPRARARASRLVSDWLNLGRLDNLTRDEERFPWWTTALGTAMKEETLSFFEHVAFEESLPLGALYSEKVTFASSELAEHYGLTPGSSSRIDLSNVPERGGLLTQGALLTIGGNSESMVGRGLFILENLLCGHLSSAPPGVDTTPPDPAPGASQRTHSEERVTNTSCSGCHSQMEPVSWSIERFDATGRYRLEDDFGNALFENGFLQYGGTDEQLPYATARELNLMLAESKVVKACLATKTAQFALGRPMDKDPADDCTRTDIQERFANSEGTFRDLVVAVVTSSGFRSLATETP